MTLFFEHFQSASFPYVLTPFDTRYNLILVACFLLASLILFIGYHRNPLERNKMVVVMVIIIVVLEVLRQIWAISMGDYLFDEMLPFHLCGIQVFLMPLYLKIKSPRLLQFIYLTALPGALAALLFNDTVFYKYPIMHFQTIQTFVIHTLIAIVPLFILIYTPFRPKLKWLGSSLFIMFGIMGFAWIVNYVTQGNYLFIRIPPQDTPIEWMANWLGNPGYILGMMGLVIFIWLCMILPFEMASFKKTSVSHPKRYVRRNE